MLEAFLPKPTPTCLNYTVFPLVFDFYNNLLSLFFNYLFVRASTTNMQQLNNKKGLKIFVYFVFGSLVSF